MLTDKIEKTLLWILRIGVGIALVSVLITSTEFFFPFIIPRAVLFQIVTELLFVFALVLMVFYPKHRPKLTILSGGVVLLLICYFITTLTSADILKSFLGTVERSFGFFHILHFGILFLAAQLAFKTQRQWNLLIAANILIGLYPSLDFLISLTDPAAAHNSMFGNPTFLAAFLIFNIFFSAFLITQTRSKHLQVLLLAVIVFQGLTLMATGVRGAFLGLSAAILYLLIYVTIKYPKWRLNIILFGAVLLSIYIFIFINRDSDFLKKNSFVQQLTEFSLQDSTVRSRFSMWKMAWSGFLERPILGWGRENYSLVFNKYFDPSFNTSGVGEGWEDRTHNIIFDEIIQGGLLSFAAYIFMIAAAFIAIRKNALLTAMLIAYIVQNMFGVDSLNSHIPLFLFLAFANFLCGGKDEKQRQTTDQKLQLPKIFAKPIKIAGCAIGISLTIVSSYFFTVEPALANKKMNGAYRAMVQNQFTDFETLYNESNYFSRNFPPLRLELSGIMSSVTLQNAPYMVSNNTYLQYAEKIASGITALYNRIKEEQRWTFVYAQLLTQKGVISNNEALVNKAESIWQELLSTAPTRKIFLHGLEYTRQGRTFLKENNVNPKK